MKFQQKISCLKKEKQKKHPPNQKQHRGFCCQWLTVLFFSLTAHKNFISDCTCFRLCWNMFPLENHHCLIIRGFTWEVSQTDHYHKVHAASSPAFGLPSSVKLSFTAQQLVGEQLCQPHWSRASFREGSGQLEVKAARASRDKAGCPWITAISHARTAPHGAAPCGTAAGPLHKGAHYSPRLLLSLTSHCSRASLSLEIALSASTNASAFGRIRCVV